MASQSPFPLMPPKSTELRLQHFDEYVYTGTTDTILYKLLDALCGTTGAGALLNQTFLARMSGALQTIYFNELDYAFGKIGFLARSPAESYPYNPMVDLLTTDQWDEIRVKDAWYRARVSTFFQACGLGGTPQGIAMVVEAALAVDCDIYEVWRYVDNFGLTGALGRAPVSSRNEVVVRPHKESLAPEETRLMRDMLEKLGPQDAIYTVNSQGLAVLSPVPVKAAAADSTYYEVQKMVTGTPALDQLPPPEMLPIDLLPTEAWLYASRTDPALAPYAAFNITAEYGYYYLVGGGKQSPIDSVTYGTIAPQKPVKVVVFELSGTYALIGDIKMGTPSDNFFARNLSADFFQWTPVAYPGDLYPMDASVAQGTANLINAINSMRGPFILVGYSQGAIITSNVYDEIRYGSLQHRRADLLAGIAFGNPRRQAGKIFPGGTDPGGHGVMSWNLLQNTEDLWWEFANPGDPACTTGDDQAGQDVTTIMGVVFDHFSGILSLIVSLLLAPIVGAEALIQGILDLFYGFGGGAHGQYQNPAYHPVPGDSRYSLQIGADYISSLSIPNLAALDTVVSEQTTTVTCYEVGEITTYAPQSWFSTHLDPSIRYIWVPYPSTNELPLQDAIDAGVTTLTTMINRNPGPFLLIGTGEGAIVTSIVYDEVRTGALQHRRADFKAGVAFGNPRRQVATIFPGGTDPGGHGISATRLATTESLWWEFANPGDLLATIGDDTEGGWYSTLFDLTVADYTGDIGAITVQHPEATVNLAALERGIIDVVFTQDPATPHATYGAVMPVADDPRTSYEIARDYLNTFAGSANPWVPMPIDPMIVWKRENNYQIFDTTGAFTNPIPYEKADSPDNFPGGKYGMHPDTAPALNPDSTPYHFAFPSQQAYITVKAAQVLALGGKTNPESYQLPVAPTSSTSRVFYPDYGIAFYPPAKDSTVSSSLTLSRSGGQVSPEIRDPINFVRPS